MAVGMLADGLPVSRPAVSQHLRVLKDAGLVAERRAGTRRFYRLDPRGVIALRDYVDSFWDEALEAFKVAAEAPDRSTQTEERARPALPQSRHRKRRRGAFKEAAEGGEE